MMMIMVMMAVVAMMMMKLIMIMALIMIRAMIMIMMTMIDRNTDTCWATEASSFQEGGAILLTNRPDGCGEAEFRIPSVTNDHYAGEAGVPATRGSERRPDGQTSAALVQRPPTSTAAEKEPWLA